MGRGSDLGEVSFWKDLFWGSGGTLGLKRNLTTHVEKRPKKILVPSVPGHFSGYLPTPLPPPGDDGGPDQKRVREL